jgi:hypothetical protein
MDIGPALIAKFPEAAQKKLVELGMPSRLPFLLVIHREKADKTLRLLQSVTSEYRAVRKRPRNAST